MEKKYWFRAKRLGFGWTPSTWQGWIVFVSYFAVLLGTAVFLSEPRIQPVFFYVIAAGTAALFVVCIWKGQPPYWRWIKEKPAPEKNSPWVYLLFLIPLFLVLVGLKIATVQENALPQNSGLASLKIGSETVSFEVADTPALRVKGLSGHAPLSPDSGMLFVFDSPSRDGFWMKDMLFPIDIVWLDAAKHIVTIKPNATPDSYPTIFYPLQPSLYVVELPAGFMASHGLALGESLDISR